jgi:hypothetical protein
MLKREANTKIFLNRLKFSFLMPRIRKILYTIIVAQLFKKVNSLRGVSDNGIVDLLTIINNFKV